MSARYSNQFEIHKWRSFHWPILLRQEQWQFYYILRCSKGTWNVNIVNNYITDEGSKVNYTLNNFIIIIKVKKN